MTTLTIIKRGHISRPIEFGLLSLTRAAHEKNIHIKYQSFWDGEGVFLLVGLADDHLMRIVLEQECITCALSPESTLLSHSSTVDGKVVNIVSGSDASGVMYALCELAQRVREQGVNALPLRHEIESPAIAHRIAGRFLQGERDDSWYFSDDFWDYYTARLASNRINRLHLVTGMDSAYMSPPYPFLLQTPGYEEVIASVGESPADRRELCLQRLCQIGQLCHDRGIAFCFGIWQQRPWTENQKTLIKNSPSEDKYADYAQKSIAELIRKCPEIDILSFRVNPEAGVKDANGHFDTAQEFWYGMFDAIKSAGRDVRVELRAKGLTDTMIDYALKIGLSLTVPTKAWCEHIALPYQMLKMRREEVDSHITNESSTRRYSYDNLQHRPRSFDLQYRLWNYGSTNILLWGDPGYVSRFTESCISGQAVGLEFTAPLSMKGGHAMIPGKEWAIHIHPDMRTYNYEDERYWMWYLTFGRYSYNPHASPEVWRREMRHRFGAAAPHMEQAYLSSGKILPLITTAHFPEHPSMHYWPELYGSASLFAGNNYEPWFTRAKSPRKKDSSYANTDPSDEELFCSIEAYVEGSLIGNRPRCYSPFAIASRYYVLATQTMDAVNHLTDAHNSPEIKASIVDFTMLAQLGFYHAHMVHAAYNLCMFEKTGESAYLSPSYHAMYNARNAFAQLSALGSMYYARNLVFDSGDSTKRNGNWQDRLDRQVDPDLAQLAALLRQNGVMPEAPDKNVSISPGHSLAMSFIDNVPSKCRPGEPLKITLRLSFPQGIMPGQQPMLHYRRANMRDGDFKQLSMERAGEVFFTTIPGDYITSAFNLYVYFTCEDIYGNMHIHPGVYHPEHPTPIYIVDSREAKR